MKTLSWHILRQVTATLLLCVGVFYLLLLLGNVLRDILDLLATRAATLSEAVAAIGYLSPFVLAFALPISLLTAVLLVFGRLSADQEITAARASGASRPVSAVEAEPAASRTAPRRAARGEVGMAVAGKENRRSVHAAPPRPDACPNDP